MRPKKGSRKFPGAKLERIIDIEDWTAAAAASRWLVGGKWATATAPGISSLRHQTTDNPRQTGLLLLLLLLHPNSSGERRQIRPHVACHVGGRYAGSRWPTDAQPGKSRDGKPALTCRAAFLGRPTMGWAGVPGAVCTVHSVPGQEGQQASLYLWVASHSHLTWTPHSIFVETCGDFWDRPFFTLHSLTTLTSHPTL